MSVIIKHLFFAFPFTTIIINFEHSLHVLYVVVIATRYLLVDIMVVMVFSYLVSFPL